MLSLALTLLSAGRSSRRSLLLKLSHRPPFPGAVHPQSSHSHSAGRLNLGASILLGSGWVLGCLDAPEVSLRSRDTDFPAYVGTQAAHSEVSLAEGHSPCICGTFLHSSPSLLKSLCSRRICLPLVFLIVSFSADLCHVETLRMVSPSVQVHSSTRCIYPAGFTTLPTHLGWNSCYSLPSGTAWRRRHVVCAQSQIQHGQGSTQRTKYHSTLRP